MYSRDEILSFIDDEQARKRAKSILDRADCSSGAEGCWPWQRKMRHNRPYVTFIEEDGTRRDRPARRALLECMGLINENQVAGDSCRNGKCINPAHLIAKDGSISGSRPGQGPKISFEVAEEIRAEHNGGKGKSGTQIARERNLHHSTVYRILSDQYWRKQNQE